ncbi:unnamed protein product [Cyprideis torosa]|uniref:Uncharacterized protein n=1 Tax=Cyprideis torosa TaxID=163714 RepID=A0A7R8ZN59_9CRUS|nr:unnamed protein product [Cyprideis torosa]CAG0895457.1 unnamed protein product [Cyprideis torosa]
MEVYLRFLSAASKTEVLVISESAATTPKPDEDEATINKRIEEFRGFPFRSIVTVNKNERFLGYVHRQPVSLSRNGEANVFGEHLTLSPSGPSEHDPIAEVQGVELCQVTVGALWIQGEVFLKQVRRFIRVWTAVNDVVVDKGFVSCGHNRSIGCHLPLDSTLRSAKDVAEVLRFSGRNLVVVELEVDVEIVLPRWILAQGFVEESDGFLSTVRAMVIGVVQDIIDGISVVKGVYDGCGVLGEEEVVLQVASVHQPTEN